MCIKVINPLSLKNKAERIFWPTLYYCLPLLIANLSDPQRTFPIVRLEGRRRVSLQSDGRRAAEIHLYLLHHTKTIDQNLRNCKFNQFNASI